MAMACLYGLGDRLHHAIQDRSENGDLLLELRKICVPPGRRLELRKIDWGDFEAIVSELGVSSLGAGALARLLAVVGALRLPTRN
ncbi:MAG: hypothetical protein HC838_03840 [Spirulinaceae cyanobacterium RM2_2_10]|nr:hypothetical protein [Spirulinaceae cyanobacterium SM2_1_0]NJO19371.1 hypothetical protein [Spirulinaceae cyanobacterium RM2_2_10]